MVPNYSAVIECIINLVGFLVFFFVVLTWSSWEVQNASRRLCNLSFVCYTVILTVINTKNLAICLINSFSVFKVIFLFGSSDILFDNHLTGC